MIGITEIDIEALGRPQVIEDLDFEAVLTVMRDDLVARFPAIANVIDLESEPARKLMEVFAYRETLLRARVNDAVRANLLAFAGNADLDHLAAFYDVVRLESETDAALRSRTIIAIRGRSTAGPRDWYRTAALASDPRVADVAVYRPGLGPDITVAVLSTDNFGTPDAALLVAVDAAVQNNSVRAISDRITTVAATQTIANVVADIWLLQDAPQETFDGLADRLRAALEAESGLGFDVTRSWLTAKLHQTGVQRVAINEPTADLVVTDQAAVKIDTITLTFKGRDR